VPGERSENETIGFDATFYLPMKLKKMFAQFASRMHAKIHA
jgi:hypothetical protein